jgi:hypothetical protein
VPRFHVIAFDPQDNQTCSRIGRYANGPDAILNLPWIDEIYRTKWVIDNLYAPDMESVISNIYQRLGWVVLCVNLDDEIMKDLNDGGSSVSCPTQQH